MARRASSGIARRALSVVSGLCACRRGPTPLDAGLHGGIRALSGRSRRSCSTRLRRGGRADRRTLWRDPSAPPPGGAKRTTPTGSRVRALCAACRARGSAAQRPPGRAQVERRSLRAVVQRLMVGDADPHRGLPGARLVEGVAQRLGFEVPDAPVARSFHPLLIPVGRAAVQVMPVARRARCRPFGRQQSGLRSGFTDVGAARPPKVFRHAAGSRPERAPAARCRGRPLPYAKERGRPRALRAHAGRPAWRDEFL